MEVGKKQVLFLVVSLSGVWGWVSWKNKVWGVGASLGVEFGREWKSDVTTYGVWPNHEGVWVA